MWRNPRLTPATARATAPALVSCVFFVVALLGCAGGENRATPPILSYSTFLGGSSLDDCDAVAVDASGNIYLGCHIWSTDFPATDSVRSARRGDVQALVVKLDPTGSKLLYTTYLGGRNWDGVFGILVDSTGNAYLRGSTASPDFPTTDGAFQTAYGGGEIDCFIAKLDPTGDVEFSTYLGGSGEDDCGGFDLDIDGNIYVTGTTSSADFPTVNAEQGAPGGAEDGFVVKLNASGSSLLYSTYLGGSGADEGIGIAVDRAGRATVSGVTRSADFPTKRPFQAALAGEADAFVAKFESDGELVYSTYIGGSGEEQYTAIALDRLGDIYLAGVTSSPDLPTVNAVQPELRGSSDLFAMKLDSAGTRLIYSTYLGGSSHEDGAEIVVDDSGSAFVLGSTSSADFPLVRPLQSAFGGGWIDVVLAKLHPTGSRLDYSTYLGGSRAEAGEGIALGPDGGVHLVGWTHSIDFPTASPLQAANGGDWDVYVVKILDPLGSHPVAIGPSEQGPRRSSIDQEITDLGTLGGTYSLARAINDRGQVVGESETLDGHRHAFVWSVEEGMTDIGTQGETYSSGADINAVGQVVGQRMNAAERLVPFVWAPEEGMVELATMSGWRNAATGINASAKIVGEIHLDSYELHAATWTATEDVVALGVLGAFALGLPLNDADLPGAKRAGSSKAWAVNSHGHVVGESETESGGTHAFLWTEEDGMRDLGTLGGPVSRALAINDEGAVVGESMTDTGKLQAFVWTAERGMLDLGTLGGGMSSALGINNRGQVVGYSEVSAGQRHAFLWTAERGMADLGTLGGPESIARDINDRGQIVGESLSISGARRATLWTSDTATRAARALLY